MTAPGELYSWQIPPCPVASCAVGKREAWEAMGDDSPAQDYAMYVHEHEHQNEVANG
jgi:hypothetical protein